MSPGRANLARGMAESVSCILCAAACKRAILFLVATFPWPFLASPRAFGERIFPPRQSPGCLGAKTTRAPQPYCCEAHAIVEKTPPAKLWQNELLPGLKANSKRGKPLPNAQGGAVALVASAPAAGNAQKPMRFSPKSPAGRRPSSACAIPGRP